MGNPADCAGWRDRLTGSAGPIGGADHLPRRAGGGCDRIYGAGFLRLNFWLFASVSPYLTIWPKSANVVERERRVLEKPKLLADLLLEPRDPISFLIEPLIPAQGIVFLYGKPSIGKSPLTWRIAQAISEGGDFFGYPVRKTGPVLSIDVDTPKNMVIGRLGLLVPKPSQVYFAFEQPFDIVHPTPQQMADLRAMEKEIGPILVIWNTLRKLHSLDDKDSAAPSRIYSAFQRFFPNAVHLVSHHDKKTIISKDSQTDPNEAFSGSQAFLNDAQVGLHLVSMDRKLRKLKLVHTKSQVSELQDDLDLQLSSDGTTWLNLTATAIVDAFKALGEDMDIGKRIAKLAANFDQSESTIRRKLTAAGLVGRGK